MLVIWLGSLGLVCFGFVFSQKALQGLLTPLRENSLDSINNRDFKMMLRGVVAYVIASVSEKESSVLSISAYNYRLAPRRGALLMLSLATLGLWWPLTLSWGYFQYNGLLFLGVGSLLWILPWGTLKNKNRRSMMVQFFFGVGLFYLGAEVLMRNAGVLAGLLGESRIAFWLVDKSIESLLAVAFVGFLISLLVKVEMFTLILGMSLMLSSNISFVGALFLIIGERISVIAINLYLGSKTNQNVNASLKHFSMASGVGLVIGGFASISISQMLNWGGIFGADPQVRNHQFILSITIILFFQFVAQMIWGHFASPKKEDEMQDIKYLEMHLISEKISTLAHEWVMLGLKIRLDKIQDHMMEMGKMSGSSIPLSLQKKLQDEELVIKKIISE